MIAKDYKYMSILELFGEHKVMTEKVTTGSLESKEMGSGARKSEGKPNYAMIYSPDLIPLIREPSGALTHLINSVGEFQLNASFDNVYKMFEAVLDMIPKNDYEYSRLDIVIPIFEKGAEKYAPFNWMKGMHWSICIGCIHRHLVKQFIKGELLDTESGEPHIGHVLANILLLKFYVKHFPEGNDLPCNYVDFLK